jgi:Ran GTPase-activating protein (RanGAP) involved in mRNA processing and transport
MNTLQENDSGFSMLNDDILSSILAMFIDSSNFTKSYKIISRINKQFYRIVLNIIPIITKINFICNNFTTEHKINKLKQILNETKNITTLVLEGGYINYNVLLSLVAFLENNTTLKIFHFKNVSINYSYSLINTYKFLKALLTTTLTELKFSYIIRDQIEGIFKVIADALKINKTLTKLSLAGNNIHSNGAIMIAEGLKSNSTLKKLNLRYNTINPIGVIALAEALKYNNTLIILNLSYNYSGKDGRKAIAEALETNKTIQIII